MTDQNGSSRPKTSRHRAMIEQAPKMINRKSFSMRHRPAATVPTKAPRAAVVSKTPKSVEELNLNLASAVKQIWMAPFTQKLMHATEIINERNRSFLQT